MDEKDRAPAADMAEQAAQADERVSIEPAVEPAERPENAESDDKLPKVKSEQST